MKKIGLFLAVFIVIFGGLIVLKNNDVFCDKFLNVEGDKIMRCGREFQMRGVSSHGVQWYSDLYDYQNLKDLRDKWNINVFRIAMYTNEEDDGYIKNRELKSQVERIADNAISLGLYVVIDWHILKDNNPMTHVDEAKEFFGAMAEKYADTPNVIFEICNEPNGDTDWSEIKEYAEEVIPVIREKAPRSLVVVGTPDWSKNLSPVAKKPLNFENVAYALHFYAGSDNATVRKKIDGFRSNGLAVFVSECGMTDASGDGDLYEDGFGRWVEYLDGNNISWIFWSFSNKEEGSSILSPDYSVSGEGERRPFDESLTDTGKALQKYFVK